MTFTVVLRPQKLVSCLFFVCLMVSPANPQAAQKQSREGQISLSMEFPFEHPVVLNYDARKALASDPAVADVMRDEQLSVDTIPKGWFTASEVHLGSKNQTDLVVMGRGISLGPYSAGFWVLGQTAKGYDLVLATQAHHLALLDTRTNGLRDIETGLYYA
ncbi:MAG TPA: hypothetical protein VFF95_07250 [Candidatus Binatus sp.]|jgi:hypothetical protein|nr:hypothetical protein [Candidatus Binatus sp.]